MEYHPVTKQITDLLKNGGFWFETFEHEPVRTSEEAAKLRPEFSLHQGAKALIVRYKVKKPGEKEEEKTEEKRFAMLVFPANLKFDAKKVRETLGIKSFSFATEEEVGAVTSGIQVGGVAPFGNLFNLPVFVDESLFGNEKIIFNAGDRSFSVAMKSEDYKKLVNPNIYRITV